MLGGIVSSLVSSGMDIVCYFVMVLLFGLYEKINTPTDLCHCTFWQQGS